MSRKALVMASKGTPEAADSALTCGQGARGAAALESCWHRMKSGRAGRGGRANAACLGQRLPCPAGTRYLSKCG